MTVDSFPITSTHIVPTIDNEASGPSYSVTRLCQALLENGNLTKLAVQGDFPKGVQLDFVKIFPYGFGPKRLGVSPKMKHWLRAEVLSGGSQILHNHSLWMMPNVYPAMAIKGTSCKLVISPRGTLSATALERSAFIKKTMWYFYQRAALQNAAGFHATSEQEYRDIRGKGFPQPVAILPNGVDVPNLMTEKAESTRQLLFLGRIHPIKGIDNLLKAWKVVQDRHPDWQMVIAGPDNGGYLKEMESLAKTLVLKRCEFVGPLYGEDKQRAYAQADLYVLPTHSENFGMTVAEVLAASTPAIVTKGAPWQGLEREDAGWWIDIGVYPLVAALDGALALSPEMLQVKGKQGRDWMIRDFSWDKIAADMAEYYNWLVNGGKVPAFVQVD